MQISKHVLDRFYKMAEEDCSGVDPMLKDEGAFAKLEHSLAHQKGVTDPRALAASIGRKAEGKAEFQEKAAAGHSKDCRVSRKLLDKMYALGDAVKA